MIVCSRFSRPDVPLRSTYVNVLVGVRAESQDHQNQNKMVIRFRFISGSGQDMRVTIIR